MTISTLHQVAGSLGDNATATRRFYEEVLRAQFVAAFDPPGLVFYNFAGVRLLLERGAGSAALYFGVEDIDAVRSELLARGVDVGEPHMIHRDEDGTFGEPGTEEWMAFFQDPAGNTLAIVESRLRSRD